MSRLRLPCIIFIGKQLLANVFWKTKKHILKKKNVLFHNVGNVEFATATWWTMLRDKTWSSKNWLMLLLLLLFITIIVVVVVDTTLKIKQYKTKLHVVKDCECYVNSVVYQNHTFTPLLLLNDMFLNNYPKKLFFSGHTHLKVLFWTRTLHNRTFLH